MQRLRLTLISQVWKFARRSNVSSDLNSFRKMSCARSSASSCLPTNLYATLNTFRQYWRTMASQACWSPARQRLISASIASGGGPEYEDAVGESDDMRLVVSRLGILSGRSGVAARKLTSHAIVNDTGLAYGSG